MELEQLTRNKIVVLDGATGSNMQKSGMTIGVCTEQWILEHPEILVQLQKDYINAGSDIIFAPTFTCNRIKLREYGLEDQLESMNQELVRLSKRAIDESGIEKTGRKVYVAADLTMTGQQLAPLGTLKFEELVNIYKEQIQCILMEGVDLFVIETMMSLQECRAALLAVKESCNLPVMITMTFNENGYTLFGTDPKTAIVVLQSMGADMVGVNCSTGPEKMCAVVSEMKEYATIPIVAKPNAGLPTLVDGETVFSMGPEEFALATLKLIEAGASVVGGCCGTTPEHIASLHNLVKTMEPPTRNHNLKRTVTTERRTLDIDLAGRFMIVGERINPTGKRNFQNELREGNLDSIADFVEDQVEGGADVLDINLGMDGINEQDMMVRTIEEIIGISNIPLSIDSSSVDVIREALRIYPGRAIINSISFEKNRYKELLQLAKKYGAMFILLPVSEKGLPKTMEEKKHMITTLISEAEHIGLKKEDVVVDGLVNTIGVNKNAAIEAIETITYCREQGLATIVGLSNISFGLPERQFVNSTFLALAIQAGLTMAIANPSQNLIVNTAFAADLLRGKDEADIRYIQRISSKEMVITSGISRSENIIIDDSKNVTLLLERKISKTMATQSSIEDLGECIAEAVIKGNRKGIVALIKEILEKGKDPSTILEHILVPAICEVSKLFDHQILFLPQLIASAETMKLAIDYLEPSLEQRQDKSIGTIIIASVSGDIHDIGKNLVVLMLKNYGFTVVDLGKDVSTEKIITTALETEADIIALSALMTTTMQEMKEVVHQRNEVGLKTKIIIGGAVITEHYAKEIGADGYAKDAGDMVILVKQLLGISNK